MYRAHIAYKARLRERRRRLAHAQIQRAARGKALRLE